MFPPRTFFATFPTDIIPAEEKVLLERIPTDNIPTRDFFPTGRNSYSQPLDDQDVKNTNLIALHTLRHGRKGLKGSGRCEAHSLLVRSGVTMDLSAGRGSDLIEVELLGEIRNKK